MGDVARFAREFEDDLCVVAFAVREFGLPSTLKLSVHSGSDNFAYPVINRLIKQHDAGLHVKTAGTTWLEELIGLAEAGGDGLSIAKEIYARAATRFDELVKPYAPVVDIVPAQLPSPKEVAQWSSAQYVAALRHDQACPAYNLHFRQFLHVSFKVAAELGATFTDALDTHTEIIGRNVTDNLYRRHLLPLFSYASALPSEALRHGGSRPPMRLLLCSILLLAIAFQPSSHAQSGDKRPRTVVAIKGGDFLINGRPTYEGRTWQGKRIEGLLLNSRMVQGIFDDLNPATVTAWAYPDTRRWDPERNTREFLAGHAEWRERIGLLAITLNLQGGLAAGVLQGAALA